MKSYNEVVNSIDMHSSTLMECHNALVLAITKLLQSSVKFVVLILDNKIYSRS